MATWSLLETLGSIGSAALASNGANNIYYVQSGAIKKYDVNADTVTTISNAASFSDFPSPSLSSSQPILVYFSGALYCAVDDTGENPHVRVYKWSGAGTSWTLALTPTFSLEPTSATNCNWFLDKSENHIIFVRFRFTTSPQDFECKIYYSTDGTTWNVGTFDNTTPPPSQYNVLSFSPRGQGNTVLGAYGYLGGQFGVLPSNYEIRKIMKWNEGTTTYEELFFYKKEAGVASGDLWVRDDYQTSLNTHWNNSEEYDNDPLAGSFVAPSDTDISLWTHELGFPAARTGVLHDTDTGNLYLHLMDSSGTVDAGELITTSKTASIIIRMPSDGDVYAILVGGSGSEVWGRSEALDPPAVGFALTHSSGGIPGAILV